MTSAAASGVGLAPWVDVWSSSRWRRCAFGLWLGCAAVYALSAPGRLDIIDGGVRYEVTDSIVEHGAPVVQSPEYPSVLGRNGERYAFYQLGTPLTSLPFLLLGRWLGSGSEAAKQFAFSLTGTPFAAGVVALVFLIYGRLGCSLRQALLWALVLAFCTLLWPYAGSTFDVALQAFWLTLAVWAAIESKASGSLRWALTAGAAFAALINIQETYVVLALPVVVGSRMTFRQFVHHLRAPATMVIVGGVGLGILAVLSYNAFRFGEPLNTGRSTVPHPLLGQPLIGFVGLFFSPAKSIFYYSPTYTIALAGLSELYRRRRRLMAPVVECLIVHVALVSTLKFWAGEWAWGPRYLVASLPLACLGAPFAMPRAKSLKVAICSSGFAIQVIAISVELKHYYLERALPAFYWLDERFMYLGSRITARFGELNEIATGSDLDSIGPWTLRAMAGIHSIEPVAEAVLVAVSFVAIGLSVGVLWHGLGRAPGHSTVSVGEIRKDD